jgi:hypothetical protein
MCDGSRNGLVKLFVHGLAIKIPTEIRSFSKSDLKKWRKEMKVLKFLGEYKKISFSLVRNVTPTHLIH